MERFKVRNWVVYVLLSLSLMVGYVVKGDMLSVFGASAEVGLFQQKEAVESKADDQWQEDLLQVYHELVNTAAEFDHLAIQESTVVVRGETELTEEMFLEWIQNFEKKMNYSKKQCSIAIAEGYLAWNCFVNEVEFKLEWLISPQKVNSTANVIYTWFGNNKETTHLEDLFADTAIHLQKDVFTQQPEYFITIQNIADLTSLERTPETFIKQWGSRLQAEEIHELQDSQQQYISTLWYQTEWERSLTYGSSTKFNLQISLRMNTSANDAYIILGYPIILQAH